MNKKTEAKIAKKRAEAGKQTAPELAKLLSAPAKGKAKGKAEAKVTKDGMPKLPSLPKAARARKDKPFNPCACGCEAPTRSMWAPGHDARARGWAIRIERGHCKMDQVPENERAGAKLMLKFRKELEAADPTGPKPKLKLAARGKAKEVKEVESKEEQVNSPAVGE